MNLARWALVEHSTGWLDEPSFKRCNIANIHAAGSSSVCSMSQ